MAMLSSSEVDERPEATLMLASIRAALPELEKLVTELEYDDEDGPYRFYHQSFKVYGLQQRTPGIVERLRALAPRLGERLDQYFEEIIAAGTGKAWERAHNQEWTKHTRPIVEAYFHARWFLDTVVRYGRAYEKPSTLLDSGWAAVLCLYGLR